VNLICSKRDGRELTAAEIDWVINAYVAGTVADEQVAALLMAVFWRGLSVAELSRWTAAIIASGSGWISPGFPGPRSTSTQQVASATKCRSSWRHSWQPVEPRCHSCRDEGSATQVAPSTSWKRSPDGAPSSPTARCSPSSRRSAASSARAGAGLAPADRKLYALRDVTGTVESIPLIAGSIMSKKIAEGTQSLVLDVKVGSGAFMADRDRATELARTMVRLGRDHGSR